MLACWPAPVPLLTRMHSLRRRAWCSRANFLEKIKPVNKLRSHPLIWFVATCRAYLKGFLLQIAVLANHQNGRDTHIRQVCAGSRELALMACIASRMLATCHPLFHAARPSPKFPPMHPAPSNAPPACPALTYPTLLTRPQAQVRVFGPRSDPIKALGHEVSFTSPQFAMYAAAR